VSDLISDIHSPEDIKQLSYEQLQQLSDEIRGFIIKSISKSGGHLASNLGAVELTIALHKVFKTPDDKIIWDVGHQAYIHKILTGRKDRFDTLRKIDGLSGFPKICESSHDSFGTGHSSTSISAALGLARARDIKRETNYVVAVLGDGALTGGMAFEALNDAGHSQTDLIVVLNDNGMSIGTNVGGFSKYLSRIRTEPIYHKVKTDFNNLLNKIPAVGKSAVKALAKARGTIKYLITPGVIFEELGLKYLGPVDGHNIKELVEVLSRAKALKGPVLIHVSTIKGKGYLHAEMKPDEFHGISAFEIETGEVKESGGQTWSDVAGEHLVKFAAQDHSIVAITAAMPHGTGLIPFSKIYPDRFFDVGIAEQHAVTFAAGIACNGLKPIVAIYSTFLQRAYDQILHDVCLQNLHVVFAIDRAGAAGEDGETHQGIYDIAYLRHLPGMTVMAPADASELREMLEFAVYTCNGPVAVRYPKGIAPFRNYMLDNPLLYGKGTVLKEGRDAAIISSGCMDQIALDAAKILETVGIKAFVVNARFLKPIDRDLIVDMSQKVHYMATIEDGTVLGGFGSALLETLNNSGVKVPVTIFGFPDNPICQGSRQQLFSRYGLDAHSIADSIRKAFENGF